MEFTNDTTLPAALARGSTSEREMVGVAAMKVTCRVEEGRLVRCADANAWPVFETPFAFGGVTLGPDVDFRKRATDLIVFGSAFAPGGEPVTRMQLGIYCGAIRFELDVFGDRYWQKRGRKVLMTDAEPFTTMPLTNDRAYGGVGYHDGLPVPHSVNPRGRGFCMTADDTHDKPLPNLERPESPIASWEDRPSPACLFRTQAPFIDAALLERPPLEIAAQLMESAGQDAVPELVAQPGQLGEQLTLRGFHPDGDLTLPLPPYSGPVLTVSVGASRSRFPTTIGAVIVLVEDPVVIITYRCAFRYLFRPGEQRWARLAWPSRSAAAASA